MSVFRDATAEELLSRFSDTENYPDEHLVPYQEFTFGGKTYYFTLFHPWWVPLSQGPGVRRGRGLLLRLPHRRGLAL